MTYPADWKAISRRARNRAEWQCECRSHCGYRHGPAPGSLGRCRARQGYPHPTTGSRVELQVAQLDQNPANCDEKNLMVMCQRCHLRYDARQHAKNRSHTHAERKRAGKAWKDLFDEEVK